MAGYDVIIIGAGAAGLYCAAHAAQRGRRVLVLERTADVGAKILISGGGRCNFTNVNAADHKRYVSSNPHFARSALSRHGPKDFISLVEKHRIAFYEKTLGQLFCDGAGSARKIVNILLAECAGAEIRTDIDVRSVTKSERFRVETSAGAFEAVALVVAAGGLSIPKLGATDLGLRLARQFNIPVIAPRPGLVPLTFSEADLAWMKPLSGVSADIVARADGPAFREAALFTHRGLSGPAILQTSSYWRAGETIHVDWLPDHDDNPLAAIKRARPKAHLKSALSELLPARLADAFAADLPQAALSDLKDQALIDIAQRFKAFTLTPSGTEGYAKAEVTLGGIDVNALSQQTMEARAIPGLFFIGECVDVTGWLGGYNFQWAWSSGWAAAQAL